MNAPMDASGTIDVRQAVSAEEWKIRCDLAACYRLVALMGWDDLVFTHISARVPGPEHHFLINPYGWMFDEITASSLVKVDMECRPVLPTPHAVNPAGFTIHSAVHAAREDVGCVLHTHTPAGVAVSAQRDGLLPISQHATIALSSLGYHDYEGIAVREDEKTRLVENLGHRQSLILRNHGLLTAARSVPLAFQVMFNLQRACEIQVMAQAGGAPLIPVRQEVLDGVQAAIRTVRAGKGDDLVWPALQRRLERSNPGWAV